MSAEEGNRGRCGTASCAISFQLAPFMTMYRLPYQRWQQSWDTDIPNLHTKVKKQHVFQYGFKNTQRFQSIKTWECYKSHNSCKSTEHCFFDFVAATLPDISCHRRVPFTLGILLQMGDILKSYQNQYWLYQCRRGLLTERKGTISFVMFNWACLPSFPSSAHIYQR